MYDSLHRTALANELAAAFVAGPWTVDGVAESGAGRLDRWPGWMTALERTVADEKLRNYRYRAVARRTGLPRVIEAPKARLKEIQRWLLREILDHVPPHDAAHGFTRGRSVVSHAQLHTGRGGCSAP